MDNAAELGEGHHVKFSPAVSVQDGVVIDETEYKNRSNRDDGNLDVEFNDRKFSAASVDVLIGKSNLGIYTLT